MTSMKKNSVLLLTCLLLMLWLSAGAICCAGLPGAQQGEASGNAASSMTSTDSGFDLLDTVNVVRMGPIGVDQYKPEFLRSGIYAVVTVMAVLVSFVLIRLKFCQAVFLPFNFNWIPDYLHKKDGMK